MKPITLDNFEVTVTKVSTQGDFGGCIFWGTLPINLATKITKNKLSVNVIGNYRHFPGGIKVIPGDRWLLNGTCDIEDVLQPNGYAYSQLTVNVSEAELTYCAEYSLSNMLLEVPGLGTAKVARLIEEFGDHSLRIHLEGEDQIKLEKYLTRDMSQKVIQWWKRYGGSDDYRFFMRFGLTAKNARLLSDFYAPLPKHRLSEDPYAALSLTDNFHIVDQLARVGYGISPDDPRRLYALAEKSLFDLVLEGHTACTDKMLTEAIKKNVYKLKEARPTVQSIRDAITTHGKHQIVIDKETQLISPIAAYGIEKDVCRHIVQLLNKGSEPKLPKNVLCPDEALINRLLDDFEKPEGLRLFKLGKLKSKDEFKLNTLQRKAVHMMLANRISILTGDAGTGKTAVIRALYHVLDHCFYSYYQCAISGRATKILREATLRDAQSYTVAGLLRNVQKIHDQTPCYVVIDEAAMVDIWSLWSLLNMFGTRTRLVLVGDPDQLAPVSPGLTLHLLANMKNIPQVTLADIVRQTADCEIPTLSRGMREKKWICPNDHNLKGVELIECDKSSVFNEVIKLLKNEDPLSTKILSATYSSTYAGIDPINRECQRQYNPKGKKVLSFDPVYGTDHFHGLCVNDPVIMTENDWDRDIANGSIGEVVEAYDDPQPFDIAGRKELSLGVIRWDDDELHPILLSDVDENNRLIQLAYCLSVHKAQGSEFQRVIIPVPDVRSPIVDRCWLYTAITRAKSSVVLVGKSSHINKIVRSPTKSDSCVTGLKHMLNAHIF